MRSPFGFARRLASLITAATIAPTLAASPVLLVGMAAYLHESSAYTLYVDAFFQLMVLGIAVTLLVGIPMHAALAAVGVRASWVYVVAGALLSVLTFLLQAGQQSGEYHALLQDHSGWFWSALIAVGGLTGWLFVRRTRRR